MDYGEITYMYDPQPADSPFDEISGGQAGVATGWLVLSSGKPGSEALVAECAVLSDGDGGGSIVQTGDARYCTVVY